MEPGTERNEEPGWPEVAGGAGTAGAGVSHDRGVALGQTWAEGVGAPDQREV